MTGIKKITSYLLGVIALFTILTPALPAFAAISFDTSGAEQRGDGNDFSETVVVAASGSTMLATLWIRNSVASPNSSMTYNGSSLTRIARSSQVGLADGQSWVAQSFYIVNPSTGSHTLAIAVGGSGDQSYIVWSVYGGTAVVPTVSGFASSASNASSITNTLTTPGADWVVSAGMFKSGSGATYTTANSGTTRQSDVGGGGATFGDALGDTNATVTGSATFGFSLGVSRSGIVSGIAIGPVNAPVIIKIPAFINWSGWW